MKYKKQVMTERIAFAALPGTRRKVRGVLRRTETIGDAGRKGLELLILLRTLDAERREAWRELVKDKWHGDVV